MIPSVTLQDAIDSLYRIAVVEGKTTSTKRLDDLGQFCIAEFAKRGLQGAVLEAKLPGGGREKAWDVAWSMDEKPRITRLSGRRPPSWSTGMIEASLFLEVDFSRGPQLIAGADAVASFFDLLVAEVRHRNPILESRS